MNKPIEGMDGKYLISEDGKVINAKTGRNLKQSINHNGYLQLTITTQKGKSLNLRVHRLVAIAFIDNPDNKPEVNHIDGVKTNNHHSNLEWCSKRENISHAISASLRRKCSNKPSEKVKKRNKLIILEYCSTNKTHIEIANEFGLSKSIIGKILLGVNKHAVTGEK